MSASHPHGSHSPPLLSPVAWWISGGVALLIHAGLVILFISGSGNTKVDVATPPPPPPSALCDGRRCSMQEVGRGRRKLDPGPSHLFDSIQVDVIPALGLKEFNPKELPKLVKYEQPELVEDGVNIEKKNKKPKKIKHKDPKPKPEERDKKKKKKEKLDDILSPRDDDPRKKSTALDDIVGDRAGSVYGTDPKGLKGDPALTKIQEALTGKFKTPTVIPDKVIRTLKSKVSVQITSAGAITSFKARSSGNPHFDTAVKQAIQRFMPKEGGSARLTSVPDNVRAAINDRKVTFVFDGAKLRR
jgi:hypothetical protein